MKISFITPLSAVTVLGRITKRQLCEILERDQTQAIKKVQILTDGMMQRFQDLSTFDYGLTLTAKNDFLKMMEDVGIGGRFYVSDDWLSVSPAKITYARKLMSYLDEGLNCCEAHIKAVNETANLALDEVQQGIDGTFCSEQQVFIKQHTRPPYSPTQNAMNLLSKAHTMSPN